MTLKHENITPKEFVYEVHRWFEEEILPYIHDEALELHQYPSFLKEKINKSKTKKIYIGTPRGVFYKIGGHNNED